MLIQQFQESRRQLECREELLNELRAAQETAKLEAERHLAVISKLRQSAANCESQHGGLEQAAALSKQQLVTLQQQYTDAQSRVQQLEAQIRLNI